MKPPYSQFYLDGNIELQTVVDNFRTWTCRVVLKWLALTCVSFILLLAGVMFELPLVVVVGVLELGLCANTMCVLLTPNGDHL